MTHPQHADLAALIDALLAGQVEFIVVGGTSAILHGALAMTQDLDVVHSMAPANVARLAAVLERLDAIARDPGQRPLASIHLATSTRVKLDGVWAVGFGVAAGPPAIHLQALAERAKVRLQGTIAGDHSIGMLVDGCAPGSVTIAHSYANFNFDTGIKLTTA